MSNHPLFLGCHLSLSGPDYFPSTVKEAVMCGANTFMFYTGAPQNTIRKSLEAMKIEEGLALMSSYQFDQTKLICHAPYIVNLGNVENEELFEKSISFLKEEVHRVAAFGVRTLVLHPGNHLQASKEASIQRIILGLNRILTETSEDVTIALETMAGKGSEIGSTFEEIRQLIDGVTNKNRIGVCFDTCHIADAGYDVHQVNDIINRFDKIIGLEYLRVLHINDSKNQIGSHKDRHENIGYGTIGFETLSQYVHHPRLTSIPKILETPYFNDKAPYKNEITMLRNQAFDSNWREQL